MKRIGLGLLLTFGLSLSAFAFHYNDDKDKDKHHHRTDATEMSVVGIAAASLLGAGTYLIYRRRVRARG